MKYEKWSLGYWMLKQYIRFVDWIINNKTILLNSDKIPKNKPILFTPNHQNALSDPMSILLHTRFQPVWLARADIFKNKLVIAILQFLKIMPVYRMRDGKENLNIQIVPTGIYYSSYWKFNRNVIVNFGDPIPANQFLEEYKENPNAAALAMRNKIYDGIKPLVINIKSKKHYNDFENITELYGQHFLNRQNKKYTIVNLFKSNKKLAESLDNLEHKVPDKIDDLVKKANSLRLLIKKYKLRSWLVNKPQKNFFQIVLNKLILLIGLPVFLYGFVFNAIPFLTIDTIVRKKIKDHAFWSTFFLSLGLIVFPIFYLIELFTIFPLLPGIWLKLAFLISLPIAGKLAFKWYILIRKTIGRGRLFLLQIFGKKAYCKLQKAKNKLFADLDHLIPVPG